MPRLEHYFLGPFQIALDGQQVTDFAFDKVRALLAYLAMQPGQAHRRDALAALLWPDQPDALALKNLRHALYKLRQALGESEGPTARPVGPAPPFLLITAQTVQFNLAADFSVDVAAFNALLAACQAHRHRRLEGCAACHARLQAAAALYRGEFLEGFALDDSEPFAEWPILEREGLHEQAQELFGHLAAYHEAAGDAKQELAARRRQLDLAPWQEEVHRRIMRLLAAGGQRSAALAQYATCRAVLAAELGVEAEAETTTLYERIKAGIQEAGAVAPAAESAAVVDPVHRAGQRTGAAGRVAGRPGVSPGDADRHGRRRQDPPGAPRGRAAAGGLSGMASCSSRWPPSRRPITSFPASPKLSAAACKRGANPARNSSTSWPARRCSWCWITSSIYWVPPPSRPVPRPAPPPNAGAGRALVLDILKAHPRVSLIVTSRERLGLQAECVFRVAGLPYPALAAPAGQDRERGRGGRGGRHIDAVRLFLERARRVNRDFALTADSVAGVTRICRLTAGVPLALEFAAVWVRDFPVDDLAGALARNLDALSSTFWDLPEQHRSLRAVFNHSWNLLTRRSGSFSASWRCSGADGMARPRRRCSACRKRPSGRPSPRWRQIAADREGAEFASISTSCCASSRPRNSPRRRPKARPPAWRTRTTMASGPGPQRRPAAAHNGNSGWRNWTVSTIMCAPSVGAATGGSGYPARLTAAAAPLVLPELFCGRAGAH